MISKAGARTRAGLFDRLIDDHPEIDEIRPLNTLDRDGLIRALEAELSRLLNTRCPVAHDEFESRERTTIDYGIPDFGALQAANPEDCRLLSLAVTDVIRHFEPRLKEVQVEIGPYPDRPHSAVAHVRGRIQLGRIPESVSFILTLDQLV